MSTHVYSQHNDPEQSRQPLAAPDAAYITAMYLIAVDTTHLLAALKLLRQGPVSTDSRDR